MDNVEIFYITAAWAAEFPETFAGEGWYYWFCFPGCLPDSDAFGPFPTERAAEEEAEEFYTD